MNFFNDDRVSEIIMNYITSPTSTLIFNNLEMGTIPEIIQTFTDLESLVIINCNLESLAGLPSNLKTLDISNNKITERLDAHIPNTLITLTANRNCISKIDIISQVNMKTLKISGNIISSIKNLPPNLIDLDISNTKFVITNQCIINTLTKLKKLDIEQCLIAQNGIDNLPDNITHLSASHIKTTSGLIINNLPKNLENFKCNNSNVCELKFDEFPSTITHISIYNNKLTHVPTVPLKMDTLDISNNLLSSIPTIPTYVRIFDCSGNEQLKLTDSQITLLKQLDLLRETNITYNEPTNTFDDFMLHLNDVDDDDDDFMKHIESKTNMFAMNRPMMQPTIPDYITKLMGDDGFKPNKDNVVKHAYILVE